MPCIVCLTAHVTLSYIVMFSGFLRIHIKFRTFSSATVITWSITKFNVLVGVLAAQESGATLVEIGYIL